MLFVKKIIIINNNTCGGGFFTYICFVHQPKRINERTMKSKPGATNRACPKSKFKEITSVKLQMPGA
jgi:hypothetical protein